ncbi:MAG: molybdopterin molybdotransferase [Verrucomicrobiota bacterium]|jgi:molybdopterin molybdotransferase
MISEDEARLKILESVAALPPRDVDLASSLGCFAARDYVAGVALPNFDNSAMDGYAVVAASCSRGARLRVVGEQAAGIDLGLRVSAGEAIRIFTGAPLPHDADAVIMQEEVTVSGTDIVMNGEAAIGEFIRRAGCDVAKGQKIVSAGERMGAVKVALLASQGIAQVTVGGEVTAGIVSTGDELVSPGKELRAGQIYDSNSVLLRGLLQNCGVFRHSVEHCPDQHDSLHRALKRGLQNSVLIITGGVSVGAHDLVKSTLQTLGANIEIWRVAIKPGKPFLFGRSGQCAVFGLPGNPVSAFVTFLKFVRPAILKMMGAAGNELELRAVRAQLTEDVMGDGDRPHYVRGKLVNGEFTPVGRQESHALFGLSRSNALLRISSGERLERGAIVTVEVWD